MAEQPINQKLSRFQEIRSNKKKFQLGVLDMQIAQEESLNKEDMVFLLFTYYRMALKSTSIGLFFSKSYSVSFRSLK